MTHFNHSFTNKINFIQKLGFSSIFWLTLGIIGILMIDNTISAFSLFTFGKMVTLNRILGFSIIVFFSVFAQLMFLRLIKNLNADEGIFYKSKIRFIRRIVYISQYVLIAVLIYCMSQLFFSDGYSRDLILISAWISLLFASVQMAVLTVRLLLWLRANMDYVVLTYSFTTFIISVNLLFMLFYITSEVIDDPKFITSDRNALVSFTSNTTIFSQGYNISSILTFILVWFSSVVLLRHYSTKIGKMRLWIILGVALVYFIGQFQYQFLEYFTDIRLSYPDLFNIVYLLITNATRPIGGILAALALWSIAKDIQQPNVKNYLILAAYGIMVVLASTQAIRILYAPYPPFGITTITFMLIGSYSMLLGIYFSAVYVSQDSKLRQTISRTSKTSEQLNFLKNIGRSEMENEIQKNVKLTVKKVSPSLEEESGIQAEWEQNIKDYVDMVLKEREKMKKA